MVWLWCNDTLQVQVSDDFVMPQCVSKLTFLASQARIQVNEKMAPFNFFGSIIVAVILCPSPEENNHARMIVFARYKIEF